MTATTYELSGVVTALSSIIHSGGESLGITTKLRREKFVQPDGSVEEVPVLSGNGIRGRLRDLGMAHFCRLLGYGVDEGTGRVRGLSMPAFYFLFSGGSLTKGEGAKALDLAYVRRLREAIPLVGVFGGAVGSQLLPGKLKVDKLYPICAELSHLLPDRYRTDAPVTIWEWLQEEMYTRKDDEKNEHLRPLLAPDTQLALDAGMKAQTLASAATPQQMMYFVESFAAGSRFYWRVLLDDVTDIEFEAFLTCLAEFSRVPYLGGRSAAGLGHVAMQLDQWRKIDARICPAGEAIDVPIGAKYSQHVAAHADEIREMLAGIA
jgi:hypothetical protein